MYAKGPFLLYFPLNPLEDTETGICVEGYFGYSEQKGDLCMIKIYGFLEGPAPTGS
jgi:hypothetical protein